MGILAFPPWGLRCCHCHCHRPNHCRHFWDCLSTRGSIGDAIPNEGFRPNFRTIQEIYKVGFLRTLMISLSSVTTYGINRILLSISSTATAVLGVYYKLQSFVFMPIFGLNNGMVPIIAYNYGARNRDRVIQAMRLSITYAVVFMIFGFTAMQLFPIGCCPCFNASGDLKYQHTALRLLVYTTHWQAMKLCVHQASNGMPLFGDCKADIGAAPSCLSYPYLKSPTDMVGIFYREVVSGILHHFFKFIYEQVVPWKGKGQGSLQHTVKCIVKEKIGFSRILLDTL